MCPAGPPRAAHSHSSSEGRRLPCAAQYVFACAKSTQTIGWSPSPGTSYVACGEHLRLSAEHLPALRTRRTRRRSSRSGPCRARGCSPRAWGGPCVGAAGYQGHAGREGLAGARAGPVRRRWGPRQGGGGGRREVQVRSRRARGGGGGGARGGGLGGAARGEEVRREEEREGSGRGDVGAHARGRYPRCGRGRSDARSGREASGLALRRPAAPGRGSAWTGEAAVARRSGA